jgi:DNA-directed RNA polymerase specialized sigma subunit
LIAAGAQRPSTQPTVGEIAIQVGASEEDVLEALRAFGAYQATSLDAPRADADDSGATSATGSAPRMTASGGLSIARRWRD